MMKYNPIMELVKGTHNGTQHQNNAHPKNTPIGCDGMQLTGALCHMVPISILWYIESGTIQLKYTFETGQKRITVSYHPTHHHGHNISWYVYVS